MNFFSEISLRKSVCVLYTNPLISCDIICISRQKCKVEQLPVLLNVVMESKSRQNICLASSVHASL